MQEECCNQNCNQGRDCPLRAGTHKPASEFAIVSIGTNDIQLLSAGQQAAPDGFFSYCDDDGFNTHGTLQAAKADAQNVIDMLREEAGTDEWPGAVDSVCYGVIVGKSTEVPQEPGPNGEETADYLLLAATPEAVNPSETPNSSTIAVPRGWKLVPDDATPEWIENLEALPDWREAVGECIKKFLAAAPAAPQAAPAAVAVPDAVRDAEKLLRAEAARLERIYGSNKWYGFSAEKESYVEHLRAAAALAATPADHIADAGKMVAAAPVVLPEPVSDAQIKSVFLANGFTIKEGLTDLKPYVYQAARALLATGGQAQAVERGEVLVTVSGFTGSGKSAIAGEIEILCRALGLQVEWPDGDSEKNMTHADWTAALEQYKPRVHIVEQNIPFAAMKGMSK